MAGPDPGAGITEAVIGDINISQILAGVRDLETAMGNLATHTTTAEEKIRAITSQAAAMGTLATNAQRLATAMSEINAAGAGAAGAVSRLAAGGGSLAVGAQGISKGRQNFTLDSMVAAGTMSAEDATLTRFQMNKVPSERPSLMGFVGAGSVEKLRAKLQGMVAPSEEELARFAANERTFGAGINPRQALQAALGMSPEAVLARQEAALARQAAMIQGSNPLMGNAEAEARARFGQGGASDRQNAIVQRRQAWAGQDYTPLWQPADDVPGERVFFGQDPPRYPEGSSRAGQINRPQWRTNARTDMRPYISPLMARQFSDVFNDEQMAAFSQSEAAFVGSVPGLRSITPTALGRLTGQERLDAIQMMQPELATQYPNVLPQAQREAQEKRIAREDEQFIAANRKATLAQVRAVLPRSLANRVVSLLPDSALASSSYNPAEARAAFEAEAPRLLADNYKSASQMNDESFLSWMQNEGAVPPSGAPVGPPKPPEIAAAEKEAARASRGGLGGLFGHGVSRGLFMYPGFMLAQAGFSAVGSAFGAMASTQTADTSLAWMEGYQNVNPDVAAQAAAAQRMGASMGYMPADSTNTYTESYRLTHDQPSALKIAKSVATMSRLTGTDPATTQTEIAPVYKALGVGAANAMPDILARGAQLYDVAPAQLEQTVAKAVTVASMIGIDKKSQTEDLAWLTAASAALEQDVNLSPGSANSALRMFGTNLRNASKSNSKVLKSLGFTDFGTDSIAGAAGRLGEIEKTDPGRATSIIEALSGTRSGLFFDDIVKHLKDINDNTKQMAQAVSTGLGSSYVSAQMNSTISGQMSQLDAQWQRLWSAPNGPGGLVAGAISVAAGGFGAAADMGTLRSIYNPMLDNPDIKHGFMGTGFLGSWDTQDITGMYQDMVKKIQDPKTPGDERARLIATYNQVMHAKGDLTNYNAVQTPMKSPSRPPVPRAQGGKETGRSGVAPGASSGPYAFSKDVPVADRGAIIAAAGVAGVSPALMAAQLRAESNFDPHAISASGAQGIAQFIPDTAAKYGLKDPFNPIASIGAEGTYMRDLITQYGSVQRALSAYNSGHPDAYLDPNFAQGQTYKYVRKVMADAGQPMVDPNARTAQSGKQHTILGDMLAKYQDTQMYGNDELTRKAGWDLEPAGTLFPDNSSYYGAMRGGLHLKHLHTGLDLRMDSGTKLVSPWEGTVVKATKDKTGYGNEVEIEDINHKYTILLAHLSRIDVKMGQSVQAGSPVGLSGGAAGDPGAGNSTGAHLHMGVIDMATGHFVDPQMAASYALAYAGNAPEGKSGGVANTNPYAIIAAGQTAGPAQTGTASTQAQTQIDLLQQLVDNTSLTNGQLSKIASFNVPAGMGIPVWEAWAAYSGSNPGPAHSGKSSSAGTAHRSGAGGHSTGAGYIRGTNIFR